MGKQTRESKADDYESRMTRRGVDGDDVDDEHKRRPTISEMKHKGNDVSPCTSSRRVIDPATRCSTLETAPELFYFRQSTGALVAVAISP